MTFEEYCKSKSIELSFLQTSLAKHILEFEHIDCIMQIATGKTVLFNLLEDYFKIERKNVDCKKLYNPHITEDYEKELIKKGYTIIRP